MALLTREAISRKTTFEMVEVDVTEWGAINPDTGKPERTTVFVRELSVAEKGKFEMEAQVKKGGKVKFEEGLYADSVQNFGARMVIATCCDADGELIFRREDIDIIMGKPVKVLNRICDAARKLNGWGKKDFDDEEETVKN
jgi:hypothetical protein